MLFLNLLLHMLPRLLFGDLNTLGDFCIVLSSAITSSFALYAPSCPLRSVLRLPGKSSSPHKTHSASLHSRFCGDPSFSLKGKEASFPASLLSFYAVYVFSDTPDGNSPAFLPYAFIVWPLVSVTADEYTCALLE